MAKKGKHLFAFIQSLTPKEVRIVRHHFGFQPGAKRYETIFDVLLKMEHEDQATFERRLKRKLKDPGKLGTLLDNVGVYKVYLYDAILEALAVHYAHAGSDLDVLVRKVEIEIQREHWSNGRKLLKKAKFIAEQEERFDMLIRLLEAERVMCLDGPKAGSLSLEEIGEELHWVGNQIVNLEAYRSLDLQIKQNLKAKYRSRGNLDVDGFESLAKDCLLQSEQSALSIRAKIVFYHCRFEIENALRRTLDAQTAMTQLYHLFEDYPQFKSLREEEYFEMFPRLIISSFLIDDEVKGRQILSELKDLENSVQTPGVLEKFLITELTLANFDKEEFEPYRILIHLETNYEKVQPFLKPERDILICYLAFRLALHLEDYQVAKDWAKKVIYINHSEVRLDLQVIARVLHLIVLYELREWEILDYYGPSHLKFIKKQTRLYPSEKALIRFLQKTSDHLALRTIVPALKALKADISDTLSSEEERSSVQYFDILQWIEAQILRYTGQSL